MAKLLDDFMVRASSNDQMEPRKLFQIKGCYFSGLKDRPGVFIFAPKDADRSLPLRKPRASVRAKLHDTQPVTSTPKPASKNNNMEL